MEAIKKSLNKRLKENQGSFSKVLIGKRKDSNTFIPEENLQELIKFLKDEKQAKQFKVKYHFKGII